MEKRPTIVRPEKVAIVEELADRLDRASMAVLTDYRGLTVSQMAGLRRDLRPADADLQVTKNTLVRLAARRGGHDALLTALEGPTAIVFSYGDPAALAKALTGTIRAQRLPLQVKSALLDNRLIPAADVTRLAELPTRDVLIGMTVGAIQSPIQGLANALGGILAKILAVLEARRSQLEGGESPS
ncbi:MAG: 50S ribosomal protein L10 [Chloroflexi bacterium]|nr:50S ribosomal protein L10 [Chloroflexota bacterium]